MILPSPWGDTEYQAWSAYVDLRDLEPDAERILCWHSERIPGPLHSERYQLKQHESRVKSQDDVLLLLSQRKARIKIFTMEHGPNYCAILSESSLYRLPGGYSSWLMVDQAEHLLGMMNLYDRLELRILPFAADISFVNTDFEILRFASDKQPDFAYIEGPGGARKFAKRDELAGFQEHWDQLHAAALNSADSKEFLRRLVKRDKPPAAAP